MNKQKATNRLRQTLWPCVWVCLVMCFTPLDAAAQSTTQCAWQAGAAQRKITPETPMWMSGYAHRDHPAEGTLTDLYAKALCLQDSNGQRVLLITLDLVGIDKTLSDQVRDTLGEKLRLDRSQISLCTSHTHTGPVVAGNLGSMYDAQLDSSQRELVSQYAAMLSQKIMEAAAESVASLRPCHLEWGSGTAAFAVNRRNNPEGEVPARRVAGNLVGPVDHDVPVLVVRDGDGAFRAIVFGYACHSTVLSSYQWSGDYGGFAQLALEADYPGCVAMFWAGCGADQNPLPRRQVELAQRYGYELAGSVKQVLDRPLHKLEGTLTTGYVEIPLPFGTLPTRAEVDADRESKDIYVAARARRLLAQIDAGQPLSPSYPYPITRWTLGKELEWLFLGGEVVVDYALRLKSEQRGQATWVAAYTNDVMAYIPSRRVLQEGGYEGGGAMVYYGLPTAWAPEVEADIMHAVKKISN